MKIVAVNAICVEDKIGRANDPVKLRHSIRALPCLHLIHGKVALLNDLVIRQVIWDEVVILILIRDIPNHYPFLVNH